MIQTIWLYLCWRKQHRRLWNWETPDIGYWQTVTYLSPSDSKKYPLADSFSVGTYGVISYGSGWMKDVVNQCLESGSVPVTGAYIGTRNDSTIQLRRSHVPHSSFHSSSVVCAFRAKWVGQGEKQGVLVSKLRPIFWLSELPRCSTTQSYTELTGRSVKVKTTFGKTGRRGAHEKWSKAKTICTIRLSAQQVASEENGA